MEEVLKIVAFLNQKNITKKSRIWVIGGGILQDVGAFACALYKRSTPRVCVPTTLVSQVDTCLGGKAALNFQKTKNLLGLFTPPDEIYHDIGFLKTLPQEDFLSGFGEVFRSCLMAGGVFMDLWEKQSALAINGDFSALQLLVINAFFIKKSVVEFDEFESNARKALNYGHSIGHAIEALTEYEIPHGISVVLGILIENEIAYQQGVLSVFDKDRISHLGRVLIANKYVDLFMQTSVLKLREFLSRDKKTLGTILKLAAIEKIGMIRFLDIVLSSEGMSEVILAWEKTQSMLLC